MNGPFDLGTSIFGGIEVAEDVNTCSVVPSDVKSGIPFVSN
jgi:hypothetical protein